MAFYHVGNCNCPSGCCDCGDTVQPDKIWFDFKKNQFFLAFTGGIMESEWIKKYECVYIGIL